MISVQTALEIVSSIKKNNFEQKLPLLQCLNLLSAEEVIAPIDVPSFDNSAMDGYVCKYEDIQENSLALSTNEIPAGISNLPLLTKNTACRIFTGAPIPENADTVIPQEDVFILDGQISFLKDIQQFSHIRRKGSQTKKGAIVLTKGTILTAEYIGFLATLGIVELLVYRKPSVGIIITGKELVPLGNNIGSFQIF
jgi:molybdopterin molybdotransferase